jgi:hypothetical protein
VSALLTGVSLIPSVGDQSWGILQSLSPYWPAGAPPLLFHTTSFPCCFTATYDFVDFRKAGHFTLDGHDPSGNLYAFDVQYSGYGGTYDGSFDFVVSFSQILVGASPYGGDISFFGNYQVKNAYAWYAGVPEPTTWALMIGGFAIAGGTLRRRPSKVIHA